VPLYRFDCPVCHTPQSRILSPEEAEGSIPCKVDRCSGLVKRTPKPPSSNFKEVHDNGAMARKVETYPDVQQIMKDRSDNDERNKRLTIFDEDL
jgi:hypothetical protein